MKKTQRLVRILLTCVILYFVWNNAHWSVAVALTLNAACWETFNYYVDKLAEAIKA